MAQQVTTSGLTSEKAQSWDLSADVVVIGSGAAGLPAAIKAADNGASVIVVETNYDIGGHAIISGGNVPLGGGTSAQKKYGIQDSPDTVFSDLTDWSIVQNNGWPDYRYNDREVMRAFADHCAPTY
jgi:succinate dehydrogenase/fumarate reductase flavoprotein subunit